jgi:endonuclease-8
MEGPSLKLTAEELSYFIGKTIQEVTGNTKMGKEHLCNKKVLSIFSWGKHLVFQFDTFAIRIHFLLFGSYRAHINGQTTEGDYYKPKEMEPRLKLDFKDGNICFYSCSIKRIDDSDIKKTYDFSIDIMNPLFSKSHAFKNIITHSEDQIADILLDQTIFSGVGNIIKNEVLFIVKINPETVAKTLNHETIKNLIEVTQSFSNRFYELRKSHTLKAHLQIYRKQKCPRCNSNIIRGKTGKRQRNSFFCPQCQPL